MLKAIPDDLDNIFFWAAKSLENLNDFVTDWVTDNMDIIDTLEAGDEYQRLGYPLGKSRRGFKKWYKSRKTVLDAEIIT